MSQIGTDLRLEMKGEIVNELGDGIASSNLTDVQYRHNAGRYIASSTVHDVIFIYSEQQNWLYLGDVGALDVGGCDIEAFKAAAPYSYRIIPRRQVSMEPCSLRKREADIEIVIVNGD